MEIILGEYQPTFWSKRFFLFIILIKLWFLSIREAYIALEIVISYVKR